MPVNSYLHGFRIGALIVVASTIGLATPLKAELVVSQMIVELTPVSRTADVLIFNDSSERSYVSIEPQEVLNAGTPSERRVTHADPRVLGLLLSSKRLILEPQQKRLLRLAATSIPQDKERVYRVTVKPVVGEVEDGDSGLKLLVGYEMLIMMRPANAAIISIVPQRTTGQMTLTNRGNASVELLEGKRCLSGIEKCAELPGKRLYAGASWTQPMPRDGQIHYRVVINGRTQTLVF